MDKLGEEKRMLTLLRPPITRDPPELLADEAAPRPVPQDGQARKEKARLDASRRARGTC
jgi:hypothetical protein